MRGTEVCQGLQDTRFKATGDGEEMPCDKRAPQLRRHEQAEEKENGERRREDRMRRESRGGRQTKEEENESN